MFLLANLDISVRWEEYYTPLLGQCLQMYRDSAAGFTELTSIKRCFFCLKHPKMART